MEAHWSIFDDIGNITNQLPQDSMQFYLFFKNIKHELLTFVFNSSATSDLQRERAPWWSKFILIWETLKTYIECNISPDKLRRVRN